MENESDTNPHVAIDTGSANILVRRSALPGDGSDASLRKTNGPLCSETFFTRVCTWASGRCWWIRLPIALWMIYDLRRYLLDREYTSFIGGLNLGIHEMGHLLFFWFGQFISAAGGTFWQLAIPSLALWQFLKQKDYFAVAFAAHWLATNLLGISVYIADARAQMLPLVSYAPSDDAMHDWQYLLSKFRLLERDTQIGDLVHAGGIVCMVVAVLFALWILGLMITHREKQKGIEI